MGLGSRQLLGARAHVGTAPEILIHFCSHFPMSMPCTMREDSGKSGHGWMSKGYRREKWEEERVNKGQSGTTLYCSGSQGRVKVAVTSKDGLTTNSFVSLQTTIEWQQ